MERLGAQKDRTRLTMGMKRRDFLVLTIGGAVAAVVSSPPAYGAKLGSVKFGVASVDPYSSPIYVADKMGYWKDEGLEVEYFDSQSGPRSKQMLAAKQIFATSTGMNDVVALSLAGKPSVVVLGIDNRVTFANILVNKKLYDAGVKSVSDLAGRSIAVTQPQAATWLMAVYITERAGLKDKVTIRGLGDFTTMMGAVKSGTVDACTATVSMINKAREEGWGVPIFDVTETEAWNKVFGGDITGVCVWVLRETLEKSADQIQALVSGVVRGTDFVRDHSPEDIAEVLYKDYLHQYPMPAVLAGLRIYKKTWNYTNLVTKEVYDRLIRVMGGGRQYSDAELATYPYEKGCEMSFVRKARRL